MSSTFDLIIVGGGAAGLWAAGTAATRGLSVQVIEKNEQLGVKILLSGGSRCNITHDCDTRGILDAFGKEQGRFLKHAVYALPPSEVVETIERLGVPTKVEDTGKVFPVSDRAKDVRDVLVRRAENAGAKLLAGTAVENVQRGDNWQVKTESATYASHQLLICCGGLSYATCGTTGDGYPWSKELGHQLTSTFPALTPLVCSENWVHELKGVTLPDVAARVAYRSQSSGFKSPKDARMISRGGFLWTHFGFSGPVPMNVSRYIACELENAPKDLKKELTLDLVPSFSTGQLAAEFDASGKDKTQNRRQVSSVVQSFVPKSLTAALLRRAEVDGSTTLAELPAKSRQKLLQDLKELRVPIAGTRGYPKAEVTRGGVSLKDVYPRTMESRIVPTLYFAGEILDIDGPIGGYNFQAAFSTGHAAALSAASKSSPQS
ncbi:MAG: NAD(P)/FAD-dependent oxidoreductase [Planctomycetota bacterium]